jgi:hypothetical protein
MGVFMMVSSRSGSGDRIGHRDLSGISASRAALDAVIEVIGRQCGFFLHLVQRAVKGLSQVVVPQNVNV